MIQKSTTNLSLLRGRRPVQPLFFLALFMFACIQVHAQEFRPPAYPLITHDPYLSIWSFGDTLNASSSKHWTGSEHPLMGFIEVDGEMYRFSGTDLSRWNDVVPAATKSPYRARYTYDQPEAGWEKPGFSDGNWRHGNAPFGDGSVDNPVEPHTGYDKEIWYRRTFTLDENTDLENLQLLISHDDGVEVFLNGIPVYSSTGYILDYARKPIPGEALQALQPGENVLAIHCTNTTGGAFLDAGLVEEEQMLTSRPALQQSASLNATQTSYRFNAGPAALTVTFTSPLLMDQLEVLARPASYITFHVEPADGKTHDIRIWFGFTGELSTDQPDQKVLTKRMQESGLLIQSVGTTTQQILGKKGDGVRIDWGYAYLAAPDREHVLPTPNSLPELAAFLGKKSTGTVPAASGPALARESYTGLLIDLGKVEKPVSEHVIMGYDDEYAVQYFGNNLRPWWRRNGNMNAVKMLADAEKDYTRLLGDCRRFDQALTRQAEAAGGKEYADLCKLAYRQAVAAHKVVAREDGTLLFFSKENYSNGSIGTVDVTYPSAPLFILYNTELMKGMLRFIFEYSESGRWKKPFPAHDVGTYPLANGQTYGEDMPVEEAGNMIILTAAVAVRDRDASFAEKHWETLSTWAAYLKKEGFDPANQLCTDDFAGHLARNANLSAKAIMGLACYGKLAGMLGKKEVEESYTGLARDMARKWMQLADDGDHYTLAFEKKGTWSQKYNLVWDKLLQLNIFPESVIRKELDYYKTKQEAYGLPLDNRKTYTKSDWILWTATLAGDKDEFRSFMLPVWQYANETPDRIPLSDWHETTDSESVGFRARSVVGGYFIRLLEKELAP